MAGHLAIRHLLPVAIAPPFLSLLGLLLPRIGVISRCELVLAPLSIDVTGASASFTARSGRRKSVFELAATSVRLGHRATDLVELSPGPLRRFTTPILCPIVPPD